MSIIADFSVPAEQFALGRTLNAAPDATAEFERVVTRSREWVTPCLWVSGGDVDAFRAEVDDDPTVRSATVSDEFESVVLYRVRWAEAVERLVTEVFERSGTLVAVAGNRNGWRIKLRVHDRSELSALKSRFDDGDLTFSLERLYSPTDPRHPEFTLTGVQRETLVAALERGYFDIPRRATASELAADLGVSTNAVSERLRRGVSNLLRNTLTARESLDRHAERRRRD
ncbi:helix-turn-helix domain-containing protein [Halorarum halobium]|uniref:helix-turn-helix domain-containing protein n=1 Tax=Halorarum halobium TaxID=3075121 RepID=UPI0028AE3536|nr:helix-turn-helix domain-containing protein [Halobaculum sp. XH14]